MAPFLLRFAFSFGLAMATRHKLDLTPDDLILGDTWTMPDDDTTPDDLTIHDDLTTHDSRSSQSDGSCYENNIAFAGYRVGSSTIQSSAEDCSNHCRVTKGCEFFTWVISSGKCFTKSSDSGRTPKDGRVSGPRYCVDKYVLMRDDDDYNDDDQIGVLNEDACNAWGRHHGHEHGCTTIASNYLKDGCHLLETVYADPPNRTLAAYDDVGVSPSAKVFARTEPEFTRDALREVLDGLFDGCGCSLPRSKSALSIKEASGKHFTIRFLGETESAVRNVDKFRAYMRRLRGVTKTVEGTVFFDVDDVGVGSCFYNNGGAYGFYGTDPLGFKQVRQP